MHPAPITLTVAALVATAAAQVPQLIPFGRTLDLLVVDSTFDGVWRLGDLAQNGDYNGAAEIVPFYDDTVGSVALTNPTCIGVGPDGTAYLADSTADLVLAMRDANGDGDAIDPGEHRVFFDATNAAGIVMASAQGLTVDAVGAVYIAAANTSSSGNDAILRLFDIDGDGDANDPGEASEYCVISGAAAAVGDSIPTAVVVAPDLDVYYTDVGATGVITKGVWRLTDLNFDGDCNDPGERNLFWTPPAPLNAFYWSLAVDGDGRFHVTDHGNETVWTARDANLDGVIDPTEETLFYQTGGSTWWGVLLRDDGVVLLCEDQTPDRLTALQDLDNDGAALSPGESSDAYSALVAPVAVRPRGAAFLRAPSMLLTSPTVPVGQSTVVATTASKPGDLVLVSIALAQVPPLPVPPFGVLEIDVNLAGTVGLSFADAASQWNLPLTVPANPNLVGSYAFQALSGDLFRPFLSNAALLTVTP